MIEVGLGGRLDCTNIISPILSVITNISFDHTQFLGNTLAQIASEKASKKAFEMGVREVDVYVKGPGMGRESSIRAVESSGLKVKLIKDVTPMPHNGCRPKKRRRI